MDLNGRTALVTGAASGIGRAISISLAKRGCHLALADLNEAGLAETAALASKPNVRITLHHLDVGSAEAIAAFPDAFLKQHQSLDILINNAGVAIGGTFEQVDPVDFEWLFSINFWGVVRMTRACLPLLRASNDARIVNLSSIFGLIAPPGQTAYVAAKFAVRGFSESLRHELEDTAIGVTVVHPGGVATSIAKNAREPKTNSNEDRERSQRAAAALMRLPPEIAGETIVKGIERRKARVMVGNDAQVVAALERIAPVSNWAIIKRLARD
jgi:NAD(P)-dependent dehydrogenase (short-subunit alcohol dehydrogenase family)